MQRCSRDKLGARSDKRCSRAPASKLGPLPRFHDRIRESYVDFRAVERYNRSKKATGPFFELGGEKSQVGATWGSVCRSTTIFPRRNYPGSPFRPLSAPKLLPGCYLGPYEIGLPIRA